MRLEALKGADKIDERLGPISGPDADLLAVFLRRAAEALGGIRHPIGSEHFKGELRRLGIPAPWHFDRDQSDMIWADNDVVALVIDPDRGLLPTEAREG